jgi:hypothetical protein
MGTGSDVSKAESEVLLCDLTVCQLMRVQNGKIVEVHGHYVDEAALNAFWRSLALRRPDP